MFEILWTRKEMNSGELYREYSRRVENPLGRRAYRKNMEKLTKLGLVEAKGFGRWRTYKRVL